MSFRARIRKAARLAAALLFLLTGVGPAAAQLLVTSHNTLHLGYANRSLGSYIDHKNASLQALLLWAPGATPQIALLQEVMANQTFGASLGPATGFAAGPLQGTPSYQEQYALVFTPGMTVLCHVGLANLLAPGEQIMRPPDAVLVRSGVQAPIWLVNFHAVFGRRIGDRRTEAALVGRLITRLRGVSCAAQQSDRVLVAGDWNLDAGDPAFAALVAAAGFQRPRVEPNDRTTISRSGGLASAYDHFVWDDADLALTFPSSLPFIACGTTVQYAAGLLAPVDLAAFRINCSDHLPIIAQVTVR